MAVLHTAVQDADAVSISIMSVHVGGSPQMFKPHSELTKVGIHVNSVSKTRKRNATTPKDSPLFLKRKKRADSCGI